MALPVLGKLYLLEDMLREWTVCLRSPFNQYVVPTQVVIRAGALAPIPRYAREYLQQGILAWNQEVTGNSGLVSQADYFDWWKNTMRQYGPKSDTNNVSLVEVWEDHGDDGHTSYCLVGYRFVLETDVQASMCPYRGLPTAMIVGMEDAQ